MKSGEDKRTRGREGERKEKPRRQRKPRQEHATRRAGVGVFTPVDCSTSRCRGRGFRRNVLSHVQGAGKTLAESWKFIPLCVGRTEGLGFGV